MAQVVNTPPPTTPQGSGAGTGIVIGIVVVVLVVIVLLFFGYSGTQQNYGTPAAPDQDGQPNGGQQQDINVEVPDEIDVNVPDDLTAPLDQEPQP